MPPSVAESTVTLLIVAFVLFVSVTVTVTVPPLRTADALETSSAETPAVKLDGNSSHYPRVPDWREGINFQYGRLYEPEYTRLYNMKDKRTGAQLSLKELVDRGIINEVWFLAYQGNYGAPLESVEVKQCYDETLHKIVVDNPRRWLSGA